MAWDTAATRLALLDAAVKEFAQHGLAGARVDRIATAAGVNKERIYQYFGNKHGLFSAVLRREMSELAAAVPLTVEQATDLGEFAGRIFDYHRRYPRYTRLLLWEGLEGESDAVAAGEERARNYRADTDAVARAQADGDLRGDVAPEHLLYAARALAAWWLAIPNLVTLTLPADDTDEARRRILVQLVNELSGPTARPARVPPSSAADHPGDSS